MEIFSLVILPFNELFSKRDFILSLPFQIVEIVECDTTHSFAISALVSPFSDLHIMCAFSSTLNTFLFFCDIVKARENECTHPNRDLSLSALIWIVKQTVKYVEYVKGGNSIVKYVSDRDGRYKCGLDLIQDLYTRTICFVLESKSYSWSL